MRSLFYFLCALFLHIAPLSASNPISTYGRDVAFDVMRNGDVVGEHITVFEQVDGVLNVSSRMNIDIFVLFIPVYGFDYRSEEKWQNGQLVALDVDVLDGPDKFSFQAERLDSGLHIAGIDPASKIEGDILSTNHWNMDVVGDNRVLNTLTGNLNEVTITPKGQEVVEVMGGTLKANRYDYSGDLTDTSVWYDDQGRWVKLQFKARDGSDIIYRCRTCLPGQGS